MRWRKGISRSSSSTAAVTWSVAGAATSSVRTPGLGPTSRTVSSRLYSAAATMRVCLLGVDEVYPAAGSFLGRMPSVDRSDRREAGAAGEQRCAPGGMPSRRHELKPHLCYHGVGLYEARTGQSNRPASRRCRWPSGVLMSLSRTPGRGRPPPGKRVIDPTTVLRTRSRPPCRRPAGAILQSQRHQRPGGLHRRFALCRRFPRAHPAARAVCASCRPRLGGCATWLAARAERVERELVLVAALVDGLHGL